MIQTIRERFRALLQTGQYRFNYYRRKVCHAFGFCPKCGDRVNFTRNGTALCPTCNQR